MKQRNRGTVLVYTMVLVVIGVFMATVVLNVATELSVEYEKRNIEISLIGIIETKGELAMKYARELNNTGSGFTDNISCPDNISMSGALVLDGDIDTDIRYLTGAIICLGTHDSGYDLTLTFNNDFDDLEFAQYKGHQISINSGALSATFGDTDTTTLDLGSSAYLSSDSYDDDFDSDNYATSSTGSVYYPDDYMDNDADGRLLNYGYVLENSGLYNAFWSNENMKNYMNENNANNDSIFAKLGDVTSGYLYLDIDTDHRLILFRIDNDIYNNSNELVIEQTVTGTGQIADVGYLQNDMSLASSTGSAYNFDFVNNDYALFIENTSSGALLYQIQGETSSTGSGIYLSPLKDGDISVFSFLGSHMLVDERGRLIGDQFEVFGLK